MSTQMIEKEELKEILRQLRSKKDIARVRGHAKRALRRVDPKTLSLAEQELLSEGFTQEELRRLCDVHLELLSEELKKGPAIGKEHPIHILKVEHKIVQQNLDRLEQLMRQIDEASSFGEVKDSLEELKAISKLLVETESHHKREEEALFPRLEKHGVTGPPRIMRMEHDELRARKKVLKDLAQNPATLESKDFKARLKETGQYIVSTLRDHIFKEDNILYPTAMKTLSPGEWKDVKQQFDEMGYCSFTPR